MSRFFLGHTTGGKELWRDSKYPYVDLRGKIPGNAQPSQGTVFKDLGVVVHWNGPKVMQSDIDQLYIDARYHIQKDWGGGYYTNGIQYEWAVGHDGTKYRLRNPGASLWHCGNPTYNVRSVAVTFLIGEGQHATKAAKESMAELCEAQVDIQGLSRSAVKGHLDVGWSACPGTAYPEFVVRFRAGESWGTDPAKPEPGTLFRVQTGAFSEKANAETLAKRLAAKSFDTYIVQEGGLHKVQLGAFGVYTNAVSLRNRVRRGGFDAFITSGKAEGEQGGGEGEAMSNLEKALRYVLGLVKFNKGYRLWRAGEDLRQPGFWGGTGPAPDYVTHTFCQSAVNLALRKTGKNPPRNRTTARYNGGIVAMRHEYGSKMVPFRLSECRRGDLAFRDYESPQVQGHIGICLGGPDDKFLQSFRGAGEDGLNTTFTLRQSHDGGYYKWRLPREAWIR